MKTGRDTAGIIETTKGRMPSTWIQPTTIQHSSNQWREAKKEAATIAKDSITRRDTEMKERIRRLEQSGSGSDRDTAQIIRRLRKAEDLKRLWQKLKLVRQTSVNRGVVRIEIPLHLDDASEGAFY